MLARERLCWEITSLVSANVGDVSVLSTVLEGASLLFGECPADPGADSMVLARGRLCWEKTSEVTGSVGMEAAGFPAISALFAWSRGEYASDLEVGSKLELMNAGVIDEGGASSSGLTTRAAGVAC